MRAMSRAGLKSAALAVALAASGSAVQAQGTAQTDLPPVPELPLVPALSAAPAPLPAVAVQVEDDPNAIRVLLSPELETTLAAQMVGRIAELQAGLGQHVAAGQTLVRFDCDEANARLKMAQAESAGARETLGVKQRLRTLEAAGDTEVALARADVQKSSAAIEMAKAQLAYCDIKAPFEGRVVKIHAKPHQIVNAGMPLLELVSEGPLKLRLNVPSRMLRSVQVDSPIEVDILETGSTYAAKVTAINARVDAVAQTIELEARLQEDPPELLPGMSGIARFVQVP